MNADSFTTHGRGKDKQPQKKVCAWCRLHNPDYSSECKERGGLMHCEHKNNSSHKHKN